MSQLSLFDNTKIHRSSDPETSRQGAEHIQRKLNGLQVEFIRRLRERDEPSTANEVAEGNESIRKRSGELKRMGLIRSVGKRKCRVTGQMAHIFEVSRDCQ